MSKIEHDSFRDEFALYLALGLLGPSRVYEHLNDDKRKERRTVPLYWRSNMMIPNPSMILYHHGKNVDSVSSNLASNTILFFDVTFEFVKKTYHQDENGTDCDSSCTVLVSLGFFILRQNGPESGSEDRKDTDIAEGCYISTKALSYEQMVSHMSSLQLDPQSVTPESLASSMAEVFLRQGTRLGTKVLDRKGQPSSEQEYQGTSDVLMSNYIQINNQLQRMTEEKEGVDLANCDIHLMIPYKSMGDLKGELILQFSSSGVSKFNRAALRFLSWDFSKNPNHYENLKNCESILSKKQIVDEVFNQWRTQTETGAIKFKEQNSSIEKVGSRDKPEINLNGSKKKRQRRSLNGMSNLPSARRKRNKGLLYDTT